MKMGMVGALGLALLTAACGTTETQRAATGGLTGAGVGALVGGPIGAVVGAAAGAGGGSLMPEGADQVAENALKKEHAAGRTALADAGLGSEPSGAQAAAGLPSGTVKEAQQQLKEQGLYHGQVDGAIGPETRRALTEYQKQNGLRETARLDDATLQRMNLAGNGVAANPSEPQAMSGSSTPPAAQVMDPAQIRDRLASDGYSGISDIRRWGNHDYTARAQKNGQAYTLEVDGHSGQVMNQQ